MNTLKRRALLQGLAAGGLLAGLANSPARAQAAASPPPRPLTPPGEGSIPVAFVISDGAVVIDFCGPWEVFQDAYIANRRDAPFRLYTVAASTRPIEASGGMKITPDHDFGNAPAPKIIVIPAQQGANEAMMEWIRRSSKGADLTMAVCTGAFVLAKTGLLAGRSATTHHSSYKTLALDYPDISVKPGARFVEDGNLATAGGLSSGIDLALRVVERYFGRDLAQKTAYYMEYQGQGWLNQDSNSIYRQELVSTQAKPLCAVCGMDIDPAAAPKSVFNGKTYYFCMAAHKERFDSAPATFAS
jgi:transcriptional regulator GlxA family with amidase domain/YHS domain-containing protein